jgi:citrate lyase beta subunit
MDERKWAKLPDIPSDAVLVDLEDSVPPPLKEAARERVVAQLRRPDELAGRLLVARPNHLSTPWGHDDLLALGGAGVTCLAYPMCRSAEDLQAAQEILRSVGADPDVFAGIETARGVVEMDAIARVDKVVAIGLGVGDLSADMGVPLYGPAGELNELFSVPRAQVAITAAAHGLATMDFVYAPDLRDLDDYRRRYEVSRRLGFTGAATFYPPHVAIINEVFTPSPAELAAADEVIGLYETAVAAGDPAVTLPSGRTILVHDYQKACRVRARFDAIAR